MTGDTVGCIVGVMMRARWAGGADGVPGGAPLQEKAVRGDAQGSTSLQACGSYTLYSFCMSPALLGDGNPCWATT